jgi:hypothetical protein
MCLASSLRERTERGVYARLRRFRVAQPWDVAFLPERQESAAGEAA